ncbi:MAG: hypothetical protein ACF8AM_21590 [Rhodopirellula sp. JB055]|uniref:hypothetical protein n=1 Tax=Rhodopirellula sp. JB055 TaxID=3342846 RepID=UPI00370B1E51
MNARRSATNGMTGATHAWSLLLASGCLVLASGCTSLNVLERQATTPVLISPDGVATPPAPVPMTLPRFLGIDTIGRRCLRKTVLLGQITYEKAATAVPALQPPPMSLPSSHPANAASPSPAVAGALKVKEAKVATAAKVKALEVLAGEDCSVNPHVEEGILAGLDDVSAEVRIAAIEAVIASRRGCDPGCGGCCSIPIRQKLTRMVFDKTGPCCWFEPSSKARRLARLALDACGGPVEPNACGCDIQTDYPIEGPPPELLQQILSE